jgi:hypothetical protein
MELRETMESSMSPSEAALLKILLRQLRKALETDTENYVRALGSNQPQEADSDSKNDTWIGPKLMRATKKTK